MWSSGNLIRSLGSCTVCRRSFIVSGMMILKIGKGARSDPVLLMSRRIVMRILDDGFLMMRLC